MSKSLFEELDGKYHEENGPYSRIRVIVNIVAI